MLKKLIPAILGLIVCVQTTSSFAGGSFFPYHYHHNHFHTNRVFVQPYPITLQQQQFVVVKKWTGFGWVYVKQPVTYVNQPVNYIRF